MTAAERRRWSKKCAEPRSQQPPNVRSRPPGGSLQLQRLRVAASTLIAYLVMRIGIRVGDFDPAVYRHDVVDNSDFRKYDDHLRMTLDCTPAIADRIEQRLAHAATQGVLRFGLHRQPTAIMTCLVPSIAERNHVHFIDGSAGGYALAAQRLKLGQAGAALA